jgi:hypothetical protein
MGQRADRKHVRIVEVSLCLWSAFQDPSASSCGRHELAGVLQYQVFAFAAGLRQSDAI